MAITKKLQKTTEATWYPGAIPMNYKYTTGVAGEMFFSALRDKGQLLASECPECGYVYLPARTFCERCFGRCEDFSNAGTKGILLAYTLSFEDFKGQPLDQPEFYGLVQIHETDTTLIHRLGGKDLSCLCVGSEVKAVLAPKKERTGSINDILHFEVIG
jgi:uncharacterized OB-fold protein